MKLPDPLKPHQIALIEDDKANLTGLLQARKAAAGKIEELQALEPQIVKIIGDLETRAADGTDGEAAITLAGRREQLRLLKANIARKDEAYGSQIFGALRAAIWKADRNYKGICGVLVHESERALTEMLLPHCDCMDTARRIAINLPSHEYLHTHLGYREHGCKIGVEDMPTAIFEAEMAIKKCDAMLAGEDVFPDYAKQAGGVKEAAKREYEMNKQGEAGAQRRELQMAQIAAMNQGNGELALAISELIKTRENGGGDRSLIEPL